MKKRNKENHSFYRQRRVKVRKIKTNYENNVELLIVFVYHCSLLKVTMFTNHHRKHHLYIFHTFFKNKKSNICVKHNSKRICKLFKNNFIDLNCNDI